MIAYDELAAALERWRIRNGLPATPPLFADARGATPPPAPRATQAIAAAPPPPAPAPVAAAPHRAPPPPPSGRATLFGMPAAAPPAPAPTAAMELVPPPPDDDGGDLGEADVLEESDPYDNEGSDFAVAFAAEPGAGGDEPTRAGGDAGSSADGWPEAHTVSTYGWGQPPPAPAPARSVEADDEATHIGDPSRRD